jgi:dolichyl-phosphate-mannose-protein mannosyltransferase
MEARQRRLRQQYDEKEVDMASVAGEREVLDDQGKWAKGHFAGPGIGGKRGLPPRQRMPGWVSAKV